MANVHGLQFSNNRDNREVQNNGSNGFLGVANGFEGLTIENVEAVERYKVLFLSGRQKVKNPREQHYGDMLKWTCCPVFKCLTFTTFILLVDLIMFVVELSFGLKQKGQFLEVNFQTLLLLGGNYPYDIRQGSVWRLITAAVLHGDFLHFLGNFVATIIFLSRIQHSFGTGRTILIYTVSAIGGNIFSALCNPQTVKVGASTSLYGLLGIMIGYLIINWDGLNLIGPVMKCQLVCVVMMTLFFIILFTSVTGVERIDYFGHLGGFLTGLWLSAVHTPIYNNNRQKTIRIVASVMLFIQFLLCFVLFYTLELKFLIVQ